jgi:predicted dinucleotide-binding enzyme
MRITILGRGPLAEPLARLAERAGHTVLWAQQDAAPSGADDTADLVILAVSSTVVETMFASIVQAISQDAVVVDATVPTEIERHEGPERRPPSRTEWIAATLPQLRIVRAFASVPVEALATVLNRPTSDQSADLAIPIAGDDREAKALVGKFMHEIGVEPFDLGALSGAGVLDPGGALWQKALSQVEMLEAVGCLSGDG